MNTSSSFHPPYYSVTVIFKPKDTEAYKTQERRSVTFRVEEEQDRDTYYKRAIKKIVKRGIISQFGIQYWDPYKLRINAPSPPSDINEIRK